MKPPIAWILLLLAISLPVQGAFILSQQLARPAHYHALATGSSAAPASVDLVKWAVERISDILAGHRHAHPLPQPEPTPASLTGQHTQIAEHGHDMGDLSVVYVSDPGTGLDTDGGYLRASADPFWGLLPTLREPPTCHAVAAMASHSEGPWTSYAMDLPEKPPRA